MGFFGDMFKNAKKVMGYNEDRGHVVRKREGFIKITYNWYWKTEYGSYIPIYNVNKNSFEMKGKTYDWDGRYYDE